jgi:hypothetical protein
MTIAIPSAKGRAQWIIKHAVPGGPHPVQCYGQDYKVFLLDDPDPDMPIWIGYDEELGAFFISNKSTNRVRLHIIRMECGRLFYHEDKTHLSAVQRALSGQTGTFRKDIRMFLQQFYQGYAVQLTDLDENEMSDDLMDIVDTAKYLEELSKR